MSIQRKVTAIAATALVVTALFVHPVQGAAAADGDVAAIVNGQKIFKKDVMSAIKELGQRLGSTDTKQVYPMVVDQIINEKLLDDAALAAKVDESKEYKERVNVIKVQLVKQMYFERLLKNKVSNDAVKAAYNQFRNENKGKIEVHARHILVPSEVEAKQAIKDLDAGQKFEEIARRRSSGPTAKSGGDLGYFLKDEMIPAFSAVAFSLKPGTYSKEPVATEFGWHVILVEDKRERTVPELKDVETPIRNKLSQQALLKVVQDLRAKADVKLFDVDGKPVNGPMAVPDAPKGAAPKTGSAAQELEAKEAAKSSDKDDDKVDDKDGGQKD